MELESIPQLQRSVQNMRAPSLSATLTSALPNLHLWLTGKAKTVSQGPPSVKRI
jgi:hypothetical protein